MKNYLYSILSLVFVSFFSLASHAETINSVLNDNVASEYARVDKKTLTEQIMPVHLTDSLLVYTRGANGLIIVPPVNWDPFPNNVSFRDTVIYDPQFLPVVFDGKILPPHLNFVPKESKDAPVKYHLIPENQTFAPLIKRAEVIQNRRRDFYMDMNNIGEMKYNASVLKSIPKINEEDATKRNFINDLIATDDAVQISPVEIEKVNPGYIYWVKRGEHSVQVSQNYISDNWNSGGSSNFAVRNYHKVQLNYKKDKVTFDNTMEWKLNLQSTPSDTEHDVSISEDFLRMENILGYKAFNNWSYSSRLETKTPLFNSFLPNSQSKNTSFLSPFMLNVSLGMGYKIDKRFASDKKKFLSLAFNLSPLSVNYKYVRDDKVDEKRFGLVEGEKSVTEFGSLVSANLSFNLNRYMLWSSRLRYFTNYERVEVEFENKFNMQLSRFFSTAIVLNTRFDDNVPRNKDLGFFQINEVVSFGLSYIW